MRRGYACRAAILGRHSRRGVFWEVFPTLKAGLRVETPEREILPFR
jgi:hypothetical protein